MAESSTLTDMIPLAIYSDTLTGEDWGRIKAAKAALDLPFLVQPAVAVSGTTSRILAIGKQPEFMCEYAFVPSTESPGLIEALKWVLTNIYDPRAVTTEYMLSAALKTEVKEVTHVGVDPRFEDESAYRASIRDVPPQPGSVIAGRRAVSDSD